MLYQKAREGKAENNNELLDWWFGTVLLTFFPLIVSVLIGLCTNGKVDFNRLFGDGELILSSFLVSTPSLLRLHNKGVTDLPGKRLFYALLIIAFLQLVAYTSIKTNSQRQPIVVYITSVLCVLSSIIISRLSEKRLCMEG